MKSKGTSKKAGCVYTPATVARALVERALSSWQAEQSGLIQAPFRILDPACGDGSLLLAAYDSLWERCSQQTTPNPPSFEDKIALIRDRLFGVDLDRAAIEILRGRFLERLQPPPTPLAGLTAILNRQFRQGDSLTGPDFSADRPFAAVEESTAPIAGDQSIESAPVFNWKKAFPNVADVGGFEIIVGNPPYIRERNAKPLFDRLAASDLGKRWRQPRMDLWYYFLHRGLDLLQPGGVLSFIVNSYWTSSTGARRLIERLQNETDFEELQLFDTAPIFAGVGGRHMIFRLRKRIARTDGADPNGTIVLRGSAQPLCRIYTSADRAGENYTVTQGDLFQNGRIVVAQPHSDLKLLNGLAPLSDQFETRQGIAENPPVVTRRMCEEFPAEYQIGEGVFVLTAEEIAALALSSDESSHLRSYYETRAVGRYKLPSAPTHQILYSTPRTIPDLDLYPALRRHLNRFRPVLERRREVQSGQIQWWHLHWPRDGAIFLGPKILSVQMGREPQFALTTRDTFVGFSINLIRPRNDRSTSSLEALAGILNSAFARCWFERHAKRRGVSLEINAHILQQFPLPNLDCDLARTIAGTVAQRMERSLPPESPVSKRHAEIEQQIEALVRQLYTRP